MVDASPYLPRWVDDVVTQDLRTFPAVQLTGPRACGKTTTAARRVAQVDRLDEPGTAEVYRLDPDAALRRAARPLLIDEFQVVPEVLPALKRAVDRDATPGQFLLTGSARAGLDTEFNATTGRVVTVRMHGLSEREVQQEPLGEGAGFLSRLTGEGLSGLQVPTTTPDIDGYLSLALRSGFPHPVLRLDRPDDRRRWLDAYLQHVATRDAPLVGGDKDPVKLLRYLEVLALNLAGTVSNKTLYDRAGIDQRTATSYDALLGALFVTDDLSAWPRTLNRQKPLAARRKRYVLDPGLAAAAAQLTLDDLVADPDLIGRWFDAFAVTQLRIEVDATFPRARLHHYRSPAGALELDLVLDLGRRRTVAFELKAAARVSGRDARHLATIRDELGKDFLAGVVLYSGKHPVELGDRLYGVPLCCLWS